MFSDKHFACCLCWSRPSTPTALRGNKWTDDDKFSCHSCDVLRLIFVSFLQRLKDEIAEVTSEIENLGSTEER